MNKCSICSGWHESGIMCAPSLPVERTSDWILSKYVQDDITTHDWLNTAPKGDWSAHTSKCQHGIYKLVSPRKLICTNCQTVIIDTQEMDGIADWMHDLCRGA